MHAQHLLIALVWAFSVKADNVQWVWLSGSDKLNQLEGSYGIRGQASSSNVPGAREGSAFWTDLNNNLWLFGGISNDTLLYNDLWKYNGNTWTWVSGSNTGGEDGDYGIINIASPSNVPGARFAPSSVIDSKGVLWLFGGRELFGTNFFNDLWKFNISSSEWTWVSGADFTNEASNYGTLGYTSSSNVVGARAYAATVIDKSNNIWVFGGDSGQYQNLHGDLWKWDGAAWTWMGGSYQVNTPAVKVGADATPAATLGASAWITSSNEIYIYGGYVYQDSNLQVVDDFWKFSIGTSKFSTVPVSGAFPGGRWSAANWVDQEDNLWLFGGFGKNGKGEIQNKSSGYMNDLWCFSNGEWKLFSGSSTVGNVPGSYSAKGQVAASNIPGGRYSVASYTDRTQADSESFYIFGGALYNGNTIVGWYNDLWKVTISTSNSVVLSYSSLAVAIAIIVALA